MKYLEKQTTQADNLTGEITKDITTMSYGCKMLSSPDRP